MAHEKEHKFKSIITNVVSAVVAFSLSWFYFHSSIREDLLISLMSMLSVNFVLDVYFQSQIEWWMPTIVFIISLAFCVILSIVLLNMNLIDGIMTGIVIASFIKYLFVKMA